MGREIKPAQSGDTVRKAVPAEFTYDAHRYRWDVEVPGYGSGIAVLFGLVVRWAPIDFGQLAGFMNVASILIIVAAAYSIQRTFLAYAFPRVIRLDDEGIEFESFGRCTSYEVEGLKRCAVREARGGKLFVEIRGAQSKPGRFFVSCADMHGADGSDGDAIQTWLFAQEERLNPDGVRVRARRQGDDVE